MFPNSKLAILLLILLAHFPAKTLQAQGYYAIDSIQVIELFFPQSNWDYLLDSLVSNTEEERLLGDVMINGVLYDSVGVRYKGNSSYSSSNVKNPLNIKLDYVHGNQDVEQYSTIRLSNGFKDPSFLREVLGYKIARNYFPASLANYAKVYVNGTYLGLYTNVQDVDKAFCRTNFGEDDGVRVKGEIAGNALPGSMGGVWQFLGADSTLYAEKYEIESDFGWNRLVGMLDTLSNVNTKVDEVLNMDRHLWFLAFSNLFVNLDGPVNNPQNYYLYQDAAGRFNPMPWDLNECFGVFLQLQNNPPMNPSNAYQLSPFLNNTSTSYPIISKTITQDLYKKIYLAHYRTMLEEMVNSGYYTDRAGEIYGIIEQEVFNDANKFFSNADFTNNLTSQVGSGPQSVLGISQLMESRKTYLSGLADFQTTQPAISAVTHSPEIPTLSDELVFTSRVEESTSVYFCYRTKGSLVFSKLLMHDDGNHQDGAAGDHIYGLTLSGLSPGIEYYIFAENATAVSFSPARAEFEFYTLTYRNDLVINEVMADNALLTDQDGETDDWIELYNNSTSSISLAGYYLADDITFKPQWAFPDTTIQPGSYMVIWADEDTLQVGLHANFKLSKSGEAVVLSDASLNVIDYVEFGEQVQDSSYGRFPNGTGDFQFMFPTLGYQNIGIIGIEEPESLNHSRMTLSQNYPNPWKEQTRIDFEVHETGDVRLDIISLTGQVVYAKTIPSAQPGFYTEDIQTAKLLPGMYVYRLSQHGNSLTKRMLVY